MYKPYAMFNIIYLEEKIVTRNAFQLAIEKQVDCKVRYSSGSVQDFCHYIKTDSLIPDLCILSDSYNYRELQTVIKIIKSKSAHPFILLKSDSKFMKSICYLMKN